MTAGQFDAIIVGAGQAGPPLAGRLTAAGQTVTVVERKDIGGTCVNTGRIPTKTLMASAHVAHLARRGAEYGVGTGHVSVDMAKVKARKDGVMLNDRALRVNGESFAPTRFFSTSGGVRWCPTCPGWPTSTT